MHYRVGFVKVRSLKNICVNYCLKTTVKWLYCLSQIIHFQKAFFFFKGRIKDELLNLCLTGRFGEFRHHCATLQFLFSECFLTAECITFSIIRPDSVRHYTHYRNTRSPPQVTCIPKLILLCSSVSGLNGILHYG